VNTSLTLKIIYLLMISLLFMGSLYFLFFKKTIGQYNAAQHTDVQLQTTLTQRKNLLSQERKTANLLLRWQKKHPDLFQALSSFPAVETQLQFITQLFQKNNFYIIKLSRAHKKETVVILQTKGHFQNLLALINSLNQFALPITLKQLSITQPDQYCFELGIEGVRD